MTEDRAPYGTGRLSLDDVMARLARIELVAFDVDGTLTDGRIGFVGTERSLFFNSQDGHGIREIEKAGIKVAWVTTNKSSAVRERGIGLKVLYLIQGRHDKAAALEELGIPWEKIAYVGDDMNDATAMMKAGVSAAVANAQPCIKALANLVLDQAGGAGAARAFCDMVLVAKGHEMYLGPDGMEWRKRP